MEVGLVDMVGLMDEVHLVDLVWLVDLVHLVEVEPRPVWTWKNQLVSNILFFLVCRSSNTGVHM